MRNVIAFFVNRPLLVNLITVLVCAFGIAAGFNLTRSLFPSVEINRISVTAVLPGASAVDVERFVTFRLEEALQGMDGLKEMTSTTTNGVASVTLQFEASHNDMGGSLERARSRLSAIRHRLPKDLEPLQLEEFRLTEMEFMNLQVENYDPTDSSHRRAVEAIEERLRRTPGIVDVKTSLPEQDIHITFHREKLERASIGAAEARAKVV
ncbi:MAG: efflux RND transporter permease subunit, partial [Proteobacteria bacterium]|nr:efflux RND transporter permease subunit [Pseudomonadota bacterium]